VLTLVNLTIAALSVPVLACTAYLAMLALLSRESPGFPDAGAPGTRFDVVVPAHDEEAGIGATVSSLLAIDYPRDLYRLIVVADNCRDATAARAAAAGAMVIERTDPERRGKGHALAHAFERSLADGIADAVVVVDADTTVTPNILGAFAARVAAGASAVQAEYGVANATSSWRTRLMHIAFTLFHRVRSVARERMGVSVGLRGNGMCFSAATLREVPHDAFSVVEDVEYGIRLGLAGHRVHFAGEALVLGDMVTSEKGSQSQRRRWEGGRWELARRHAGRLLAQGLRRGSAVLLDLALDLLVPPLTYVASAVMVGTALALAWVIIGNGAWWSLAPWAMSALAFGVYVARGVWLSRVGPRAVLDLAWAPIYMIWKIGLALRASPSRESEWVRTERRGEKP
jgi:1,2-diacylglycerol 3-beta-glucosyltransferase